MKPKPAWLIITEAILYVIIMAGGVWIPVLIGVQVLTARLLWGTAVASLVAGATGVKAFLSTSFGDRKRDDDLPVTQMDLTLAGPGTLLRQAVQEAAASAIRTPTTDSTTNQS